METITLIFCVAGIVVLGLILAIWLKRVGVFWLSVVLGVGIGVAYYTPPQKKVDIKPLRSFMSNPTVIQIVPPTRFDNASVMLRDTVRGRFVYKRISVPDSCYDTLWINQKLNYAEFQQKLDAEEKTEIEAADALSQKFIKISVFLGLLIVMGLIVKRMFFPYLDN